ncbi:hypothetical protein KSP40_PGU013046 [Platanthera guangdongensis]|uniref:Uncharacterized protein n=1 Tax=Platanthera guangdongensis TaxID=2320717 RepID=A0ABR2MMP4_9ASPA
MEKQRFWSRKNLSQLQNRSTPRAAYFRLFCPRDTCSNSPPPHPEPLFSTIGHHRLSLFDSSTVVLPLLAGKLSPPLQSIVTPFGLLERRRLWIAGKKLCFSFRFSRVKKRARTDLRHSVSSSTKKSAGHLNLVEIHAYNLVEGLLSHTMPENVADVESSMDVVICMPFLESHFETNIQFPSLKVLVDWAGIIDKSFSFAVAVKDSDKLNDTRNTLSDFPIILKVASACLGFRSHGILRSAIREILSAALPCAQRIPPPCSAFFAIPAHPAARRSRARSCDSAVPPNPPLRAISSSDFSDPPLFDVKSRAPLPLTLSSSRSPYSRLFSSSVLLSIEKLE